MSLRNIFVTAAGVGAALMSSGGALGAYPERAVRVIVGQGPSGGTDTVARIMTQRLAETFGQSFVIENRPSAGGNGGRDRRQRDTRRRTVTMGTPRTGEPELYRICVRRDQGIRADQYRERASKSSR